jgi:hypothetical protein
LGHTIKAKIKNKPLANFEMNIKSNKTLPQPVPQNLEGPQPLPTKAKLDPVLLDLIGNIKEKKIDWSDKMAVSD